MQEISKWLVYQSTMRKRAIKALINLWQTKCKLAPTVSFPNNDSPKWQCISKHRNNGLPGLDNIWTTKCKPIAYVNSLLIKSSAVPKLYLKYLLGNVGVRGGRHVHPNHSKSVCDEKERDLNKLSVFVPSQPACFSVFLSVSLPHPNYNVWPKTHYDLNVGIVRSSNDCTSSATYVFSSENFKEQTAQINGWKSRVLSNQFKGGMNDVDSPDTKPQVLKTPENKTKPKSAKPCKPWMRTLNQGLRCFCWPQSRRSTLCSVRLETPSQSLSVIPATPISKLTSLILDKS